MNDEHQYPLGTLIPYGPDPERATKLTACVIPAPGAVLTAMQRWHVKEGDIRDDSEIADEVAEFFAAHKIASQINAPEILGCEHEEGIDFPLGAFCTQCAMWSVLEHAKSHRTGKTPEGNGEFITPNEVIGALAEVRGCPPREAFRAADFHRKALVEPLLARLLSELDEVEKDPSRDSQFGCHALLLLGKWCEPKALPAVVRWFSLGEEAHHAFSGDVLLEDGAGILASVAGRDLPEIRALIENPALYEYSRGVALDTLAVLVQRGKLSREELIAYLRELIAGKLGSGESHVWSHLATVVVDLGITELVPELRVPFEEGWIDDMVISWEDIQNTKAAAKGGHFERRTAQITDVAESSAWWSCYHIRARDRTEGPVPAARAYEGEPYTPRPPAIPFIAEPKIGRNDPCPCNSGKKYKKCCGAA